MFFLSFKTAMCSKILFLMSSSPKWSLLSTFSAFGMSKISFERLFQGKSVKKSR